MFPLPLGNETKLTPRFVYDLSASISAVCLRPTERFPGKPGWDLRPFAIKSHLPRHVYFSLSEPPSFTNSLNICEISRKIQFQLHFAIETRYIEPRKTKGTVQDVLDDLGLVVDFSPTVRLMKSQCRLDPISE